MNSSPTREDVVLHIARSSVCSDTLYYLMMSSWSEHSNKGNFGFYLDFQLPRLTSFRAGVAPLTIFMKAYFKITHQKLNSIQSRVKSCQIILKVSSKSSTIVSSLEYHCITFRRRDACIAMILRLIYSSFVSPSLFAIQVMSFSTPFRKSGKGAPRIIDPLDPIDFATATTPSRNVRIDTSTPSLGRANLALARRVCQAEERKKDKNTPTPMKNKKAEDSTPLPNENDGTEKGFKSGYSGKIIIGRIRVAM